MEKIFEKYEKIEEIGRYVNVIKAKNKISGEYVIIKLIDKKYLNNINKYLSKLNIMKILSSDNFISIIETYDTKDYFYIVMELCLLNLEEFMKIRNEGLSIEEIKEILFQINLILKKMIEKEIYHENIKLSNILISLKNINHISIKLSDFGLNKIEENNLANAPEIIEKGNISIKSDIWSLGIIIYYLLFNEYPYNGKTKFELNKDIYSNKKLKKIGNNELDDLINKMLCIDYNKRISWNEYFNHTFFINYISYQNLNFPEFSFKNKINKDIKFRCKECPYIPLIGILYENDEIKIQSRCQNGHYNIEKLEEFYNRNLLKTEMNCLIGNEYLNNYNEFYYCNDCNIYICSKHINQHEHINTILINQINNYCIEHKNKFTSFCKKCSINLCDNCKLNHLNHNLINLDMFKLNKKQIEEYENKINKIETNLNVFFKNVKKIYEEFERYQINLINSITRYKNINKIQINLCKDLIEKYKIMNNENRLNYEIIENIKNIFNFKPIDCEIDNTFHILTKIQKYYSYMNNNYNCILERSKNFINIDFKITNEEKKYLLTNFKPLENNLEFIEKHDIGANFYYYGEIIRKNGVIKKHGRGIYLYSNGTKRFGCFKNDKLNGYLIEFERDGFIEKYYKKDNSDKGFYIRKYSDGVITKGTHKNGIGDGFSITYYPNGDIKIIELKDNISNGYYINYCLNGEKYEGEIKNGNKNGIGIFTTFLSKYEGEWKNNNKEGIGKLCMNNSKEGYEGEFKNNNEHGFGIQFNENGLKMYEGEYKNGFPNGYGIDYYSNGNKRNEGFYINGIPSKFSISYLEDGFIFYIGYLDNGKRDGFGSYKDKPNEKKIGFWKNDKANGYYSIFNSDGSWYRGYVKDGEFEGYGIYKWNNGNIYEGEWKNSQPHGYGIYKYFDGSIYKGMLKNNNIEGYGELITDIGIYKGEWKNNLKNGFGIENFGNSKKYEYVFYENGILIETIKDFI